MSGLRRPCLPRRPRRKPFGERRTPCRNGLRVREPGSVRYRREGFPGPGELVVPAGVPAKGAGSLGAEVAAGGAAGEVDVLAPGQIAGVAAIFALREVTGQQREEPGQHRACAAVAPERVEPVTE